MIRVDITKNEQQYKEILLQGHAGYADKGTDIVCAAVSVLVINTFNSIETFTDDYLSEDVDEKKARIRFVLKDQLGDQARLLIDSMLLGLEQIQEQYGSSYLKVNYKEV